MSLINPRDALERQNEKLLKITESLMRRVEYQTAQSGAAYSQFERAALLEKRVRQRTEELERTLDLLHESNAQLARATAEAESARRDLADAIETVDEGFAFFDPEDRLILCNSRFCRDFRELQPVLKPGLSFDDYVDRISRARQLVRPEGTSPEAWARERRARHADRHVMFTVELEGDRWLQVSEHRTSQGGTVMLQTDVTDIVRLERQERARLIDKQARLVRATLDHLDQGVAIFDEEKRLLGWNRRLGTLLALDARYLRIGTEFDGLLAQLRRSARFADSGDMARFRAWAEAESTGPRGPIDFEIRQGPRQVLHVFGRGMPDNGFVLSVTDVTLERSAAERLAQINEELEQRVVARTLDLEDALATAERANASKNRFVAAASHDLLQPLSAAKLYISGLADRLTEPRDQAVLQKAETALSSAEGLIDALLDISKLESEGLSFDIRPVALREIFGPLRDEMAVLAERKGLQLRVVDSALWVESDPSYLRRVAQNLISNAIRYTETGRVLVGARRVGGAARIEVHDTGPGIAEADQQTIFEEFKRLGATGSGGGSEGLGLGLAIVDRACARLGHPLALRSQPGRGSCFSVRVPVVDEAVGRPTPIHRRPGARRSDVAGLVVMAVENEPDLRRALALLVESWGVDMIEAEDAESAEALLADLGIVPDALLLDQRLGSGVTGTELYARLRSRYGPIPAMVISADRSPDLASACKSLGLTLLRKPVDPNALSLFLESVAEAL
ncbi:hybrid sensor histidine kinase/response regulator [Litorisediminicola beolgyonensis]|uniref:histidine kinase n=1 Tax=Litorisediminicola beolgyonensis TaxID=1173614 RepID=A0ABW3ZM82_9RHOB